MPLRADAQEYYPPGLRPRAQPRLLPAGPELIEMARVAMRGNVPTDMELSRMSRIALESGPYSRPAGRASRKRKRRSRSKSHKKRHKRKKTRHRRKRRKKKTRSRKRRKR
jgi:hypothetical protein